MGGNGSYSKAYRGVPLASRTHIDTNMRICGHKVLVQRKSAKQSKNIMNSNSENAIYIMARVKDDGTLVVHSVNVYEGHDIKIEINFKFDRHGNIIPYSKNSPNGSHSHRWYVNDAGESVRMQHDSTNVYDIPNEYDELVRHINEFNRRKRIWKQ